MACAFPQVTLADAGVDSLRGLSLVADGGVAVGSGQVILRYDGNNGWSRSIGPSATNPYDLTDVQLTDATNGWAVSTWSVSVGGTTYVYGGALKLTNGTWTSFQNSLGWGLRGVALSDAMNGYGVGDKGQITRIVSGTYSPGSTGLVTPALQSVALSDAMNGWAVGFNGQVRKLTNGTWSTVTGGSFSLYDVALSDAQTGWAVGADGLIVRMSGGTFTASAAITNRTLYSVALTPTGAWAVGQGGTVLKYDGTNWSQCRYGMTGAPDLRAVSHGGGQTWAVGDRGTRLRLE